MMVSKDANLNVAKACRNLGLDPTHYNYYRKLFLGSIDTSSIDPDAVVAAVHPAAAAVAAAPAAFPYLSGKAPATSVAALQGITLMKAKKGKKKQGYLGKNVTKDDYDAAAVWGNAELQAHALSQREIELVILNEGGIKMDRSVFAAPPSSSSSSSAPPASASSAPPSSSSSSSSSFSFGFPSPDSSSSTSSSDPLPTAAYHAPKSRGAQTLLPHDVEAAIEKFISAMRAYYLAVPATLLKAKIMQYIEGSGYEANFKGGMVSDKYLHGFYDRHDLKTASQRPHQDVREQWFNVTNLRLHFDVVRDVLLEHGLAIRNDDYVKGAEGTKGEEIFITKPGRIISMDETGLELETMTNSKSNKVRVIVKKGSGDDHSTMGTKSSERVTGVGGSRMDGKTVAPVFIFKSAVGVDPHATLGGPSSAVIDETTKKFFPAQFYYSDTSAAKDGFFLKWIKHIVMPMYQGNEKVTAANPIVMIADGYLDHTNLKCIAECRALHVNLIIRPPHTTDKTQPEDKTNFAYLKPEFHKAKTLFLTNQVIAGGGTAFTERDLMSVIKRPWDDAFCVDRCLKAWRQTSYNPFNRGLQIAQEAVEAKSASYNFATKPNGSLNCNALQLPSTKRALFSKNKRREGEGEEGSDNEDGEEEGEEGNDNANAGLIIADAPERAMKRRRRVNWEENGVFVTSVQSFELLQRREAAVAEEQQEKEEKREVASKKKTAKRNEANVLAEQVLASLGPHPWNDAAVQKLLAPKIKALIAYRGVAVLKGKKDVILAQMAAIYGHESAPALVIPALPAALVAPGLPQALPPLEVHVGGGAAAGILVLFK
jgi:hypothetical protein